MNWKELTIETAPEGIELLAAYLGEHGFDSLTIDDEAQFSEFYRENAPYWDFMDETLTERMRGVCRIRLYLEDDERCPAQKEKLKAVCAEARDRFPAVSFGSLEITERLCRDEDWENNWKAYYAPIPIGEKLLVLPNWLEKPADEERIPVILDPGLIFGTGQHASTQMCMLALEKIVHGKERVLDLGSGSGILAITALLLGAGRAVAVDIDPKAEAVARNNAELNRLGAPAFRALTGNVLTDKDLLCSFEAQKSDVVIANIVADVIIELSRFVTKTMTDGGTFLCSGIIEGREDEVADALTRGGLTILRRMEQGVWRCFVCKKEG